MPYKSDCVEWTAYRNKGGYGVRRYKGVVMLAHRVAWIEEFASIPDGMCVLHKCDNPGCINPAHLWLGTRTDNNLDKLQKGRESHLKGASNPRAKLTDIQVSELRSLYASGEKIIPLGQRFGVSKSQVWNVVSGEHWNAL